MIGSTAMRRVLSLSERFWRHVKKTESCWLWTGAKRPYGYGQLGRQDGGTQVAHRISWELHHGPIPDGMFVCHHCDNPPCVNPSHLFVGTASDNMQDCARKGRVGGGCRSGEEHHLAKLTWANVRAIRRSAKSDTALAARYGVSRGLIWFVRTNKVWQEGKTA